MNVFVELEIKSRNGTDFILEKIIDFAKHSTGWKFDANVSSIYSNHLPNSKGCVLIYTNSKYYPGFAFCEKKEGTLYIANIVPKENGNIPRSEYNELTKTFFNDFKVWKKSLASEIKISVSKTDLELKDIITAETPRNHFQTYLNLHPLSYHPLDIRRLDKFICSVSRYCRNPVDLVYLGEYLRKKKNWAEKDINWCINRIETGLQILAAYKGKNITN